MDGFNIGKIILGLYNNELFLKKIKNNESNKVQSFAPEINSSIAGNKPHAGQMLQNLQNITDITQMLQMNHLANMDRSSFIKNLLGLPQNLWEVLLSVQNPNKPLKMICPGKTYRRDDDDMTHSHQFAQIEGLLIDKNINMANLKATLELFLKRLFGENREIRLRSSYFPFTEPSVEIDISCASCGGKGKKYGIVR